MIFAKLPHQHGLPHAAVAVDGERWHARRPRMRRQSAHGDERGLCPGIMHPTLRLDFPDPQVVGQVQKLGRGGGEMFKLMFQASRIPFD